MRVIGRPWFVMRYTADDLIEDSYDAGATAGDG